MWAYRLAFCLLILLCLAHYVQPQYLNTYILKDPNSTSTTNFGTSISLSISDHPVLAVSSSSGEVYIYALTPLVPTNSDYINYTLVTGSTAQNNTEFYNINTSTNYYPTYTVTIPPVLPSSAFSVSFTGVAITSNQIAISYTNAQFDPYTSTFSSSNQTVQSAVVVYSHVNGTNISPDPSSSSIYIRPPADDNGNFGGSFPGGLAIYNNLLFIGSPTADNGAGRFYIYQNNGPSYWNRVATFYASNFGSDYLTGNSISISEGSGIAVVGSPGSNSGAGQVILFDLNNLKLSSLNLTGNYNVAYSVTNPVSLSLSEFGYAVSISTTGKYVIVSAPGSDSAFIYQPTISGGPNSLNAYGTTVITLNLIYTLLSPSRGVRFGTDVSVSDAGTAVIGTTNGVAYIYQFGTAGDIFNPTSLSSPSQILRLNSSSSNVSASSSTASTTSSTISSSNAASNSNAASISPSSATSISPSNAASISASSAASISASSAASISASSAASISASSAASISASSAASISASSAASSSSGFLPSPTPTVSPLTKRNLFSRQSSSSNSSSSYYGPNSYGLSVIAAGGNSVVNSLVIVSSYSDTSPGSLSPLIFPQAYSSFPALGTGSLYVYTQCQYSLIGNLQRFSPSCLLSSNDVYISLPSISVGYGEGITLQPNSRLIMFGNLSLSNGSYLNTSVNSVLVVRGAFSVLNSSLYVGVSNDSYLNNVNDGGNGNRFVLVQYGSLEGNSTTNTWGSTSGGYSYGSQYYQRCGTNVYDGRFGTNEYDAYVNRDDGCYELNRPNGSNQSTQDYIIGAFVGAFGPCIAILLMTAFFCVLVWIIKKVKSYIWPSTAEDDEVALMEAAHDTENPDAHADEKSQEGSSHS